MSGLSGWSRWMAIISLGNDAITLAEALLERHPEPFVMAFSALLTDLGSSARIKELDGNFLATLQPELQALAQKIFAKIGPAA